jgi:type IV secretion system protein TrbJ
MTFHRLLATTAIALMLAAPARAITVFDPSNYSQNVLQAARALEQIRNQVSSLQNEAQMLLNQARNLTSLDTSSLASIDASLGRIGALLQQADRIAYDVQAIEREFSQNYPQAIAPGSSDQALIDQARQRWMNSVAAFQHALTVQAGVVSDMPATWDQTASLVSASQSAVGILQATQAGNQLLAVQSKQLTDLTAMIASQNRAQSLEMARQAAAQEQAREQRQRFLERSRGYQPQTVRMFHN